MTDAMKDAIKDEDRDGSAEPSTTEGPEAQGWTVELSSLLDRAAVLAVAHAADHERFMSAAHEALLRADPELRAQIERASMLAQMEVLRRMGVLAEA